MEYSVISPLRFRLFLAKGSLIAWYTVIKEWTHVLVNYIGPSDGEGIRIYYNGTQVFQFLHTCF